MSLPTKELPDVLKDVPTASSLSGLWSLFANSSGEPQKAILMKEVSTGSSIINGQGVWLVAVYSKTDLTKLHIAIVLRNESRVQLHTLYQNGLTLNYNQYGTVALYSAEDAPNPVYVAMRLSMGTV